MKTRHDFAWSETSLVRRHYFHGHLCAYNSHCCAIILNDLRATDIAYHKANGALTARGLELNKLGDKGAVACSDALKATFAMCFSSGARSMFFWPSLTQCPDDNHPSTLAQTRSILNGKVLDVLLCVWLAFCAAGGPTLFRCIALSQTCTSNAVAIEQKYVWADLLATNQSSLV